MQGLFLVLIPLKSNIMILDISSVNLVYYLGGKDMNYLCKLVKGYLLAFIIFLILTTVITVFIKFTSVPESFSVYYLIAAMCIATLFLGVFSGKLIRKKGLLSAIGLSAVFVFLIVFGINCTYFQDLTLNSFRAQYGIPVVIGGIGGIIGVNVKK